jgi:hypothetical protein
MGLKTLPPCVARDEVMLGLQRTLQLVSDFEVIKLTGRHQLLMSIFSLLGTKWKKWIPTPFHQFFHITK